MHKLLKILLKFNYIFMKFFKYHGTGNDFICIDNNKKNISINSQEIKKLCDRNFGIGADGVILMTPSDNGGDVFMDYWNSDGSFAEMCGNGVRVTALFIEKNWGIEKKELLIDTRDGIKKVISKGDNSYQVNMEEAKFVHSDFPSQSEILFDKENHFASMGNPHSVINFSSEKECDIYFKKYAKKIESNRDLFPNKINVNAFWKKGEKHFGQKTFERGAGLTLACGTGASASFAWIQKLFPETRGEKIKMDIPGGTLFFEMNTKNNTNEILMTGPAQFVFKGSL